MENEAKQLIDEELNDTVTEDIGEVHIADDVICIVASLAAQEVPGVYSMSGGFSDGLHSLLGKESASKGVRLHYEGKQVHMTVYLNLEYGYAFPEVALAVQEKVKKAVEEMTEYEVQFVDVHVEGVVKPGTLEELEQEQTEVPTPEEEQSDVAGAQTPAMLPGTLDEEYYPERRYFQLGEEDSSVSAEERHLKFWEED